MATIDMATLAGTGHPSRWMGYVATPYLVSVEIDLAEVATEKGSAIAALDVIEAIDLAPDSVVLAGGVKVIEAMTGTSADATIDVGITGGDVDNFVDGFDLDAAVAGDAAASGVNAPVVVSDADTIDVLIATQTGTITGGKIQVWAVVANYGVRDTAGLAQLGS